ncbi:MULTISPECIES: chemotaxis protein CheW [unclassified Sphingomonas]|uniref:chemotaxis protein CheW n=1 Tax=unclassified Sphingomonas TaxID=196159 RepID=UPI00082CFDEA|nr:MULTISPECIES: chemotaxis protein CheW [unclassified Sphingomonas]MCH4892973.1 chemotaxis protein CheW [Sphingomonas sp. SFZ2018-12]
MNKLFLVAHIDGRAIAIDADQVDSVVDLGPVTPVPLASRQVRGLAALRSRVVTVIDTKAALGMPAHGAPRRAVITRIDGHHYALLVDALDDIVAMTLLPLSPAIPLEPLWREAARGVVERDGEPILVIDAAALIPQSAAAA